MFAASDRPEHSRCLNLCMISAMVYSADDNSSLLIPVEDGTNDLILPCAKPKANGWLLVLRRMLKEVKRKICWVQDAEMVKLSDQGSLKSPEIVDFAASVKKSMLNNPIKTEQSWPVIINYRPLETLVEVLDSHIIVQTEPKGNAALTPHEQLVKAAGFERNVGEPGAKVVVNTAKESSVVTEKQQFGCLMSIDSFNQKSLPNELLTGLHYFCTPISPVEAAKKGGKSKDAFTWGQIDPIGFGKVLLHICAKANEVCRKEPRYMELQSPAYVLGDSHGNFSDLMYSEKVLWGLGPSLKPSTLLFLGDYVDRGPHGVEVVASLFAYKVQNPLKLKLIRGNHEIRDIQKMYTFLREAFQPKKSPQDIKRKSITPMTSTRASITKGGAQQDGSDYELAIHSVKLKKTGGLLGVDPLWQMDIGEPGAKVVVNTAKESSVVTEKQQFGRLMSVDSFNQKSVPNELLTGLHYFCTPISPVEAAKKGGKSKDAFTWGQIDPIGFGKVLLQICAKANEVCRKEPRYMDLQSPVYVLGDLHGNFPDLMYFEKVLWGLGPSLIPSTLSFLGDYVDRGPHGVEVVAYLFAYKVQNPLKLKLIRGNHEIRDIQKMFTFLSECTCKFGETLGREVWNKVNDAFDSLPLAASIDGKIFCCHGGIPPPWLCPVVSATNNISCPLSQPDQQSALAWDLMQNDPVIEEFQPKKSPQEIKRKSITSMTSTRASITKGGAEDDGGDNVPAIQRNTDEGLLLGNGQMDSSCSAISNKTGFYNINQNCYMNASVQLLLHTVTIVCWLIGEAPHHIDCDNIPAQAEQRELIGLMSANDKAEKEEDLSDELKVQLHTSIEQIINVFGDTIPENIVKKAVLRNSCKLDETVDELLNLMNEPPNKNEPPTKKEIGGKTETLESQRNSCIVKALMEVLESCSPEIGSMQKLLPIYNNLKQIKKEFNYGQQEDASEFSSALINCLENERIRKDPNNSRKSLISLLSSDYKTTVSCCCGAENEKKESTTIFTLDSQADIISAFADYFSADDISNFLCDSCKNRITVKKKSTLIEPAEVLIFSIRSYNNYGEKLHNRMKCPTEITIPERLYQKKPSSPEEYNLKGIIVHIGTTRERGHYVVYCKTEKDMFHRFNDSIVSPVSIAEILDIQPYMVVYEKSKRASAPTLDKSNDEDDDDDDDDKTKDKPTENSKEEKPDNERAQGEKDYSATENQMEAEKTKKIEESSSDSITCVEDSTKAKTAAVAVGLLKETEFDIRFNPDVYSPGVQLDIFNLKLLNEISNLEAKLVTYQGQFELKEAERAKVTQAVADANADLEALRWEQHRLVQSWNSVIISISQRDKVYAKLMVDYNKIEEQFRNMKNDIEGLKRESKEEMLKNERLTLIQNRVQAEEANIERLTSIEEEKKNALEIQLSSLQHMIEETDKEITTVTIAYHKLQHEDKLLQNEIEKLSTEKLELEEKIIEKLQDQITQDKATKYLNRLLRTLRSKTKDQEVIMVNTENQLTRTGLEAESQKGANDQTQIILDEKKKQLEMKEKQLDNLELELSHCMPDLGKKQVHLDLLNKKLEQLSSRNGQDPTCDGGQWEMIVNVINKHGLMPKKCFPESFSCESSVRMNAILKSKLCEYTRDLRNLVTEGASDEEINTQIQQQMDDIYRTVGICLGIPSETFTWDYYDKSKQYNSIGPITPVDFYVNYVKTYYNMDDKDSTCDGGQWDMILNVINKHGLMPKKCFPESFSCESSVRMNAILKSKLCEYMRDLHNLVTEGAGDGKINTRIQQQMAEIYRIVGICLGIPSETFTWDYYNKAKQYNSIGPITPVDFYIKYVKPYYNVDDKKRCVDCVPPKAKKHKIVHTTSPSSTQSKMPRIATDELFSSKFSHPVNGRHESVATQSSIQGAGDVQM